MRPFVVHEGSYAIWGCPVCGFLKNVPVHEALPNQVFWCKHGSATLGESLPCLLMELGGEQGSTAGKACTGT